MRRGCFLLQITMEPVPESPRLDTDSMLHLGKATELSLRKIVYTCIHTYTHPAAWNEMWKWNKACPSAQTLSFDSTHQALAAGSREQCQGTGHLTWFLCGEFQTIIIKFREAWCHASGSGITHTLWANHVTSIFIACNYICGDRRGWLDEAPSVITA